MELQEKFPMKITKYIHSCLLFEHEGEKLLFDPGLFTFVEDQVKPDQFSDVTTVVLTHSHPDHLNLKALKEILETSKATVISNRGVAEMLRKEGIEVKLHEEGTMQAGAFTLQAQAAAHQPILADEIPPNTAYLVNGRVLNPGDSFDISLNPWKGTEILILPVMAPFLTEVEALAFARRMEPKEVIPVHDGYAKDFFLKGRYDTYELFLKKDGVKFHRMGEVGASVKV
jgi:L-ascorbate metabolism protein UlaG (beta-lactamase superfamily)